MNRYLEKLAFIPSSRHTYKDGDWSHLENPVLTHKLDGANFILKVENDGSLKYYSRRPSVKGHYIERSEQLPQLTKKKLPQYAGNEMTVELIHTGHQKHDQEKHSVLSGILNSKKERSLETQRLTGPVRAALIDVKSPEINTYLEKIKYLQQVARDYGNDEVMFTPELHVGKEAINRYLALTKARKDEGGIITDLHLPESENPRFKVKHQQYYNLKVSGQVPAISIHGEVKPEMGALLLEDAAGKHVGKVGTGFTREERQHAHANPEDWKGKLIQVKAMGPAGSNRQGLLRAPVYNGDADGDIDIVHTL